MAANCPKCGFTHGWDGTACGHCKFTRDAKPIPKEAPSGDAFAYRSGGIALHAFALVLLGAGIGTFLSDLDKPAAGATRTAWLLPTIAATLVAVGIAVSCLTVDTRIEGPANVLTRTRHWLFGLYRSRTEYAREDLSAVAIEILRVWTQSSGSWTIYNVALLGPRLRIVIAQFRSEGTANGTADDPKIAHAHAHQLAAQIARQLSVPVDIRGGTDKAFPGEYSAFPRSELAQMTREELMDCLRRVLAARNSSGQHSVEFDSARKREDSAFVLGGELSRFGGWKVLKDELKNAPVSDADRAWLVAVWGLEQDVALDQALEHVEQFGIARKPRDKPEGGFDWSGLDK